MVIKLVSVGLLGCSAALLGWHYSRPPALVFQTLPVDRGDMESVISSTGTCSALVTVQVGSQVSGIIIKLYADFNSTVHKGELLAEIDPEPFIARLNQAKAALDGAKASAQAAKAGVEMAQAAIHGAKEQEESQKRQMSVAKSAADLAKLQADRATLSAKAGVGMVSDQVAAQSAYEVAADAEASAEAQEDLARVTIDVNEAAYQNALTQVTSADAQVRQAEGVVQQAQVNLDNTKILSPTDGIVLARQVDVGQTVAASAVAPTLFQIAQDLTQMQVDANIDQADVSRVAVGEDATFTVDALPNVTYRTKVSQIRENPTSLQNVVTYDVILRVDNPDLRLFPGMTTNIRLETAHRVDVLKVPSAALRFVPKGAKQERNAQVVYTLNADNQPLPHPVQTGLADGRFVEVTSGDLQEGEAVVVAEARHK